MILKKSVFAHFLIKNDMCCAYNALTMKRCFFNKKNLLDIQKYLEHPTKNNLLSINDVICQNLQDIDILIPKEIDEEKYLEKNRDKLLKQTNIRVMILHMTDFCNLRCKYCFVEHNMPKHFCRQNMSKEVMHKAIDKFVSLINKYKPDNPIIVFYGGEPLLNWETVLDGLEYLSNVYPNTNITKSIITNGTLIVDGIAAELKKHNVNVGISIDGDKISHDANRIYPNQKGSWKDVLAGIQILKKHNIEPSASCVLPKGNISRIHKILECLIEDIKFTKIGFNHVSVIASAQEYDPEYEEKYSQCLLDAADTIIDKYPYVYEQKIGDKLQAFLSNQITRSSCTACGEQINVSTQGEIGLCQGFIGTKNTFNNTVFNEEYDPNQDEMFIEWGKRTPFFIKECLDCIALSTCGGGCPKNAKVVSGSAFNRDISFCHFSKKVQEWLIWKDLELNKCKQQK